MKAMKHIVLVMLLALALCLPVSSMAETITYEQSDYFAANAGLYFWFEPELFEQIQPDLCEPLSEKFIRDWDGDGTIEADELNENISISWSGMTFTDGADTVFGNWGEARAADLRAGIKKALPSYDGKQVTLTLVNKNTGDQFVATYTARYNYLVTEELGVECPEAAEGTNYEDKRVLVPEGASVSITSNHHYEGDQAFTLKYKWIFINEETMEETVLSANGKTYSFTMKEEGGIRCETSVCNELGNEIASTMDYLWFYYPEAYSDPFTIAGTVGATNFIYPFNNEVLWNVYGIEDATAEELNERLSVSVSAGKGIEVLKQNFTFKTFTEDGYEWLETPYVLLKFLSKEADGESVVFSVKDKSTGITELHKFTIELNGVVRGEETIVSEKGGKLTENAWGNYVLKTETGGSLKVVPNYTTFDGKPADVIIEWRVLDEDGFWTTENELHTGSSYTFENIKAGYSYQWEVYLKEDHSWVDTLYVLVQNPDYVTEVEDEIVVTEGLAQIGLDTPQKIQTEIETTIFADALKQWNEVPAENVASFEVSLYQYDGDDKIRITSENWPEDLKKLTVQLPYPQGSSPADEFMVVHMFATDVNGKEPGTYEYPEVRKLNGYLEFEVTGLSPIAVVWREAPAPAVPATGDSANPLLWLMGMSIAAFGMAALTLRRRQHN